MPPLGLGSPFVSAAILASLKSGDLYLPSLRISNKNYNLYLFVGRFPAELGPETHSNGSGSKNGAERTPN